MNVRRSVELANKYIFLFSNIWVKDVIIYIPNSPENIAMLVSHIYGVFCGLSK